MRRCGIFPPHVSMAFPLFWSSSIDLFTAFIVCFILSLCVCLYREMWLTSWQSLSLMCEVIVASLSLSSIAAPCQAGTSVHTHGYLTSTSSPRACELQQTEQAWHTRGKYYSGLKTCHSTWCVIFTMCIWILWVDVTVHFVTLVYVTVLTLIKKRSQVIKYHACAFVFFQFCKSCIYYFLGGTHVWEENVIQRYSLYSVTKLSRRWSWSWVSLESTRCLTGSNTV